MKNLTPLPNQSQYIDRYIAIRDKKKKDTKVPLIFAHKHVAQSYMDFANAVLIGTLARLVPNVEAAKISNHLRACYDSPTQHLKELKQAILDAQPKRLLKYCPMCGTTLPRTFDHYMPAIKFPEFAVHPMNLVPCCATCNSTKDADWVNEEGNRQYVHAYLDQLPDLQFVSVTLHQDPIFHGVGATFSIKMPIGMPKNLWTIVASHFKRLSLIERYDDRGNDEIGEILADCRSFIDAGGTDVKAFLQGRVNDRKTTYGRNHWIVVLMDAMARHQDLEDWIEAA